ncbi:MAG TPA: hypothetical protein DEG43_08710 [Acidimicrobiaceae bacterium]|jgi:class 3 adenylate cyclase|nr:hypothetical protein [Acidimicrobiaceae bacterium]
MASSTTQSIPAKRLLLVAPAERQPRADRVQRELGRSSGERISGELGRLMVADADGFTVLGGRTEQVPAIAPTGTGVERPVPEWVELSQSLSRVFAFVDVSGFTRFTDLHGAHAATEVLTRFRTACRDVATRRGVRVAKWLGDGVMLVGTEAGAVVASVAELMLRFHGDDFDIHAGIAAGTVLLFEGDDYIGRPVNLAARLCEAAGPEETLAVGVDDSLPDWVEILGTLSIPAAGIGEVTNVRRLRPARDAWASPVLSADHPSQIPIGNQDLFSGG